MAFTDSLVLILIFFAPFGLAWILGHSRLTLGLREWLWPRVPLAVELLECPGCLGFWIGLVVGGLYWKSIWMALIAAFATTGVNVCLGFLTGVMNEPAPTPPTEKKP